ncbi:hypothetical protein ACERII_11525 [Evansella sp. AB-rgal1]|uniref:hypothetical protein n=1 Tax=Evansella sp. AB-rgal1 TaxID=3242696 RepID=UPI00359DE2AC
MDFTKLDNVFKWMKANKVTGMSKKKKDNGSGFSNGTNSKYKYELHTMYNYMENHWGVTDFAKLKQKDYFRYYDERIKEYHEGNTSVAYHLRGLDDAMAAFNHYCVNAGEFQYKLKFPKKEKLSHLMDEMNVYRKAKDSSVMAASRKDVVAVCTYLREMKTQAGSVAADALWGEFLTGRRINAQLRHKVGNFNEEEGSLTSCGDNGGKDNFGFLRSEAIEHYSKLCEGKRDGSPILTIQYQLGTKAGQDKSIEKMRVHISELIKTASDTLIEEGKLDNPVTSHSARKGFAQEEAFHLLHKTKKELEKELDKIAGQDPKLKSKFNNVLKNIRDKFKNPKNAAKREFTKKELVSLLVSVSISHSRIDVMRYYLTKEFWKGVEENHRDLLKNNPNL